MFGFKNNDNAKSGPFSLGSTTLIAEGTELEGDLHFKGNLEVEGSIVGNILSEDENARVRVLQGGSVHGEVWMFHHHTLILKIISIVHQNYRNIQPRMIYM